MPMTRRCFVAGNWKMNKTVAESLALVRELRGLVSMVRDRVEVAIAPPFTALHPVAKALEDSNLQLAAQNCHWRPRARSPARSRRPCSRRSAAPG